MQNLIFLIKEVEMTLDQNSLIAIAFILSITVIGVIALTRNTDTKLDLKLGKDKSLTNLSSG